MKVSVIIVTYNSEATINDCLGSVISSSLESEVVVVDNNSTENTIEVINKFPSVKLIQNKENLGFGSGNNLGVKNTDSEYIFFLNPDTKVETGAVEKLGEYLDNNADVAAVGPKLLNSDGSIQKELANFPTLLSQLLILLRLHRFPLISNLAYPNFNYDKTQEAEHLMGAALMVRRSVFEEIGGFDEKFFLWFEETDLLKRIKEAGYKIVYYPEAVVTHLVGQSTKQLNFLKRQTIWNKSLLYYFSKHKTWLHILVLLPFIILSYPAALISYLVKK